MTIGIVRLGSPRQPGEGTRIGAVRRLPNIARIKTSPRAVSKNQQEPPCRTAKRPSAIRSCP